MLALLERLLSVVTDWYHRHSTDETTVEARRRVFGGMPVRFKYTQR